MGRVYHDWRRTSPGAARLLVKTVRKARECPTQGSVQKPKNSARRLDSHFEELILCEAKRTGYDYRRLSELLRRKYSLVISSNTARHGVKRRDAG